MSDNYVRRLNYSNGQLLDVSDFADEQAYHLSQRRLHNRDLHGHGIVSGLEVQLTDGETDLAVSPGSALDKLGREIVLTGPDPEPAKLKARTPPPARSSTFFLTLAYHEEDDERAEVIVKDSDGNRVYSRRRVQRPLIQTEDKAVTDGSAITLAKVTVDAAGKLSLDVSVRTRSGGLHPATALAVQQVQVGGQLALDATRLSFTSVDAAGAGSDGITWYPSDPTRYGIHRTAGAWTADTGYQQLRISWSTGIVIDPGSAYDKSHVEVQGKGLHVSTGGLAVGPSYLPGGASNLSVEGKAGIGVTTASARLDVTGRGDVEGEPSLLLRGGNTAKKSEGVQLAFGYGGTDTYRHSIRTRHNASARSGNAIDFYVWRYASASDLDKADAIGSRHTMTLDGGNVGIGTTDPGDYRLKVAGGDSQFDGALSVTGTLKFGESVRQMIDLYKSEYGIGVQDGTAYFRSGGNFAWYVGGSHDAAKLSPGPKDKAGTLQMVITNGNLGIGATGPQARLDVEGDAIVAGTIKGRYKDDQSKRTVAGFDPNWLGVVSKQNAAVLQGFSTSAAHALWDNAEHKAHQFTIGYRGEGTYYDSACIIDLTTGAYKTFVIDHPLEPERYLLHATLEGPEGAVYYRGSARLHEGRAEVRLPPYFEALTRAEGRTVLLSAVDGHDPLAVLTQDGARIRGGVFIVASNNPHSQQAFDWEVKAVRSDAGALEVEPAKRSIHVERFGPYAFEAGRVVTKD